MSPAPPARLHVHAGALAVGEWGVLVRGASGSGKSSLADALVAEARRAGGFGRIVADDVVVLESRGGRLVARPHPRTAGLAERRGAGVVAVAHEAACVLHLVVDFVPPAGLVRMPDPAAARATLAGIALRRLALEEGTPAAEAARRVLEACAGLSRHS